MNNIYLSLQIESHDDIYFFLADKETKFSLMRIQYLLKDCVNPSSAGKVKVKIGHLMGFRFSKLTFLFFLSAANHLSWRFVKQEFSSTSSKGHGLLLVDLDTFCVSGFVVCDRYYDCKVQSWRVYEKLAFTCNSFWTRTRWDKLNIYFLPSFLPILYLLSIFFSFAGLSLSFVCEKRDDGGLFLCQEYLTLRKDNTFACF